MVSSLPARCLAHTVGGWWDHVPRLGSKGPCLEGNSNGFSLGILTKESFERTKQKKQSEVEILLTFIGHPLFKIVQCIYFDPVLKSEA